MRFFFAALLLTALMSQCRFRKKTAAAGTVYTWQDIPGPRILVYQSKEQVQELVPVVLNDSGTAIVSYPAPGDVSEQNRPTRLRQGYWLDNRGVAGNVAYLDFTWKAYSALKEVDAAMLMAHIKFRNPFTVRCDCGYRDPAVDAEKAMNRLILDKKIKSTCKLLP